MNIIKYTVNGCDFIKRVKIFSKYILIIYAMYCLIFKSNEIRTTIKTAIDLWQNIIIPSVFPYLVLSEYIASGKSPLCNKSIFIKFISGIFKINPCSVKAVFCSVLCGYPSGAICANTLYTSGEITKEEANRLIRFTNNAGPVFLISAVGGMMLNNTAYGFAIYIIQIISAMIYGAICGIGTKASEVKLKYKCDDKTDFSFAVKNSVKNIINICGFMVCAYLMAEITIIFLKGVLPASITSSVYTKVIINSLFEISAGVNSLSGLGDNALIFAFLCSAVSWSGISVILQIKSVAKNIISIGEILKAKFYQAIISFCMGYLYIKFINIQSYNNFTNYLYDNGIYICVLIFLLYIVTSFKKITIIPRKR